LVWEVISTSRFNLSASWLENFSFGQPEVEGDDQTPRTFRVSLGVRF
jgi:hypothetical protein